MVDFKIEKSWSRDGYDIWVINRTSNGSYLLKPTELIFKAIEDGTMWPEPSIKINGNMGRDLVIGAKKAIMQLPWFEDVEAGEKVALNKNLDDLRFITKSLLDKLK